FLAAIWFCGFCAAIVPILYSAFLRKNLRRDTTRVSDERWCRALSDSCERLHIAQSIQFLQKQSIAVPVTWGTFRPVIIIPNSANDWGAERKNVVLLHELAHVRRCDFLTQTIAQIACALFWFNPLVWRAAAAMRADREQA